MSAKLKDLLKRFKDVCEGPENRRRRELWERHTKGLPCERPPAYMSVPFEWSLIRIKLWTELLGRGVDVKAVMAATSGDYPKELAEDLIAFQLEQRIFYIEKTPGDMPVRPELSTNLNLLWLVDGLGQNAIWERPGYDIESGAFHLEPFLSEDVDPSSLKTRPFNFDPEAHRRRVALFKELCGDGIEIQDDALGRGYLNGVCPPFQEACNMRGLLNVLTDMRERPDWLKRLLRRLCELSIARAEEMSAKTGLRFAPLIGSDEVNCQMFSPEDYRDFVFPVEMDCAKLGSNIYYHSCGRLTPIYKDIAKLPNIGKIHVSPWSDLRAAVEAFEGKPAIVQRIMDTQREIVASDEGRMASLVDEFKAGLGASRGELACHCETAADFEKSCAFVKIAQERLGR